MSGHRGLAARAFDAATVIGSAVAVAATAHTAWNLRALRVPPSDPPPVRERVSVLVPARDEAARIGACVAAIVAQVGVEDLEVLVLDDGSTDGTAAIARLAAADDPRVRVIDGTSFGDADRAAGWLGKTRACHRLAQEATGEVLVFVDADVLLEPHAVAATVATLRWSALDVVCPYPRQLAETPAERLVQPLLQWSWLTFLPLGPAERSPRESLVAANGQLLAIDRAAYERAGGHAAVRGEVLDDIALMRVVKASGGRGVVVDGTHLATCRMYESWPDLRDGYSKSLWSAFGSPAGAIATMALLKVAYVVPPLAALRGSRTGMVGTVAGVAGRAMVAQRVGGRVWPDSAAHPVSIGLLGWLTLRSWRGRRAGSLTWKGRTLP